MFRECFFEYAGQSSQPFNLALCYTGSITTEFDSGGKYDLKTDTLPRSHETFLYGKDYSAQPLSFEVDILNIYDHIPFDQLVRIKNWLYEQNGWKTLRIIDGRRNYYLKCIFEPGEDIADGTGYKGLHCTIHNASPFWYGDQKEYTVSHSTLLSGAVRLNRKNYSVFELDFPQDESVGTIISPTVKAIIDKRSGSLSEVKDFELHTCGATSIADGQSQTDSQSYTSSEWIYPNTSELLFDITYLGDVGSQSAIDNVIIDTKYGVVKSTNFPQQQINLKANTNNILPMFSVETGKTICRIRYGPMYDSLVFSYTPVYRVGAF